MRVTGQNFLTDSFDQVRRRLRNLAGLLVGLVDRADGIGADNLDVLVFLFQKSTRPGNCAAGSDAGDEVRDLSFRLLPKLGTGCALVGFGIGWM